ncbi:MAG TPA: transposase [Candidatus Methylacidiphilales bacterium]|nr:transposase [Candidatus Methylacidiphilales bacterium]
MRRLSRLEHIYEEHPLYFFTFCTPQRQDLLANPQVHDSFRTFAQEAVSRDILVGRYVLMPDHMHLFATFGEQNQISMWIKSLKNTLSKTLRTNGVAAPHWQKGFFDHLLRGQESYEAKWQYVYENRVRKALVTDAGAWPYQGEINPLDFD